MILQNISIISKNELTRKELITQQEILDELKAIRLRDEKEKN